MEGFEGPSVHHTSQREIFIDNENPTRIGGNAIQVIQHINHHSVSKPTDRKRFFSQLNKNWWELEDYSEIVRKLRHYAAEGKLRSIAIVTSGPVSVSSIESLELELSKAFEISGVKLPQGILSWHALNHNLDLKKIEGLVSKLNSLGADFVTFGNSKSTTTSVSMMFDSRDSVQEYVDSIEDDPIICWLDSDLEFSALIADGNEVKVGQPWPWIHMVWNEWIIQGDADFLIGDVTGDPPVPASSTILSNLRDLAKIDTMADSSRWSIRDPSYDLSEIDSSDAYFPAITGNWLDGIQITEALLWKGTLNRPLVASSNVLIETHRPWFVRGGVTVVFNRDVMKTPTPRIVIDGVTARRGDSFWLIRNTVLHRFDSRHFPFPLLHRRTHKNEGFEELISSFESRLLSDLFGASALKGTSNSLGKDDSNLVNEIGSAVSTRIIKTRRVLLEAMKTLYFVKEEMSNNEFDVILKALRKSLEKLNRLDVENSINTMAIQITHYLTD